MLCNLTNVVPEEPVVSVKSGHLYEKRVILKFIEENRKCPATGQDLSEGDLLTVKASKVAKPRPATATAIPTLLGTLQNEWDALMIETFTMRQHIDTVRQELAHSLYQHDAACRVIARLVKERDQARMQMNHLQAKVSQEHAKHQAQDDAMETDEGSLPEPVVQRIKTLSGELTAQRKRRTLPEDLATTDALRQYEEISQYAPHSTAATKKGVLCVNVHKNDDLIATGGADGLTLVYSRSEEKIVARLEGHASSVRAVLLHPTQNLCISAGDDHSARVWRLADGGSEPSSLLTFREPHGAPVRGLALHASGDYLVTASEDNKWAMRDLASGNILAKIAANEGDKPVTAGFTCAQFHPDGAILALGTGHNFTSIWDVRSLAHVAQFAEHTRAISSVAFSENGYYLATASLDGLVRLWDLRKLNPFNVLEFADSKRDAPTAVQQVSFDESGAYIAVAANNVKIYETKQWNNVVEFHNHTEVVTGVSWGQRARWLASSSIDRTIRLWGNQ